MVPITSLYTAILIAIAVWLMFWIISARRDHKVALGDGGDKEVLLRMRSQSNFIEITPLALIAMLLLELNGMPNWFLHAFGVILVVTRLVHPLGMTNRYKQFPFRVGGTVATVTIMLVAVVALLWKSLLG